MFDFILETLKAGLEFAGDWWLLIMIAGKLLDSVPLWLVGIIGAIVWVAS